jgi:hypothetical protein
MSTISFWQTDQNYQNSQQAWAQQLSNSSSMQSVLTSALSNQASGLASIANARALDRVNSQIAAAQSGTAGSTSSTSSAAAPSSAPAAAASAPTYSGYLASTDANSLSGATAASLLSGELPIGSILSILA